MGAYNIASASDYLATKPLPVLRTRNTISSSAELDGAQTNTWARYLRLELTTSGFCREMFCLVRSKLINTSGPNLASTQYRRVPVHFQWGKNHHHHRQA